MEGNVGEDVHHRHQDDGDRDGPRKVADRILEIYFSLSIIVNHLHLKFLDDEVEIIPAVVSKQTGVEG